MDQADKPIGPSEAPQGVDPVDMLEFELTDIGDARRVLDEESISQFDVAAAATPSQWKRLRRPLLPTDRALSGRGIDWLLSLPPDLHPGELGRRFPRIVNALADVWDDPDACQAVFARLLGDDRKGRAGFLREVHKELLALRAWTQVF